MSRTLINGTGYDISGGRTLFGGTGYGISGGKTLFGGTGETISFVKMPVKGNLIQMNVDGTDRQYRVLKVNGNVAEVMETAPAVEGTSGVSRKYSWPKGESISCGYYSSNVGSYIINTIYPTFTSQAKNAIVPKTIYQDSGWYSSKKKWGKNTTPAFTDSSVIRGTQSVVNQEIYGIVIDNPEWQTIGTVPIYLLSVSEMYEYLKDQIKYQGIYDCAFYSSNITDMFLRGNSISDWQKDGFLLRTYAGISYGGDDDPDAQQVFEVYTRSYSVGPVSVSFPNTSDRWILLTFQIDLTKIPFTIIS